MSDIEELIGRYLVLSQKSESTLNIFFFHQRAVQALLPRLKIANKQTFLKRANQNFRNSKKKILFRHCANTLTKSKEGLG